MAAFLGAFCSPNADCRFEKEIFDALHAELSR
jgi:hypothetical protein